MTDKEQKAIDLMKLSDDCGEDIYEGDDFYEVDNETNYCEDCMHDRKKEAIYHEIIEEFEVVEE